MDLKDNFRRLILGLGIYHNFLALTALHLIKALLKYQFNYINLFYIVFINIINTNFVRMFGWVFCISSRKTSELIVMKRSSLIAGDSE